MWGSKGTPKSRKKAKKTDRERHWGAESEPRAKAGARTDAAGIARPLRKQKCRRGRVCALQTVGLASPLTRGGRVQESSSEAGGKTVSGHPFVLLRQDGVLVCFLVL